MPTFVSTGDKLITADGRPSWLPRPSMPLSAMFDASGLPMVGGKVVSYAQMYRTQWAVAVAVNKLARQVSRLPLKPFKRNPDGQRDRLRNGYLAQLLANPWAGGAATHLKQAIMLPALVHGNGALRKVRNVPGGPVIRFAPLTWSYLVAHDVDGVQVGTWETTQPGEPRFIDPGDVLHFAFRGLDGPLGVSPLQQLGVTLSIEDAAQRHQRAMLSNGAGRVSSVEVQKDYLPVDPEKRQQAFNNLRTDIDDLYVGPEQQGKPWLLPPGLTANAIGQTAVEAALIEQRKITREEAFSVYDVSPPLVGLLERSTFSNITELHRMLYVTVLGPWLTLLEETLEAQLIAAEPTLRGDVFVEFDLSEVLKGDLLQRSQALALQIGYGVLTIDEAREIENRQTFGLDETTHPLYPANNLKVAGSAPTDTTGGPGGGGGAGTNATAPSDSQLQDAARELAGMPEDDVRHLLLRTGGSAIDLIFALADDPGLDRSTNGHQPAAA